MSFNIRNVVPWGRSFEEYVAMFSLTEEDLTKRILGCGDGPASFNAVLTRQGGRVISIDPIYSFTAVDIRQRIAETRDEVLGQLRKNRNEFVWDRIRSVEELGQLRMSAMETFLEDYETGLTEGRYVLGELPTLPFADHEFGVALCSHLLFLYSEQNSLDFHLQSVRELCRVAGEVRIFPLHEFGGRYSRHLEPVRKVLQSDGFNADIVPVDYEFQRGSNEMLRIVRNAGE